MTMIQNYTEAHSEIHYTQKAYQNQVFFRSFFRNFPKKYWKSQF